MLLYYITDRTQLAAEHEPDAERVRGGRLLTMVEAACAAGVDLIQLRERDLSARELEGLASHMVEIASRYRGTRLLINSRIDVAVAAGADGVHLRSNDLLADDARAIVTANKRKSFLVSVSCHTVAEVEAAANRGADLVVFGPVFGKTGVAATGVKELTEACNAAGSMPVLALGGIGRENVRQCLDAGAAGVAGIKLFQNFPVRETVALLRAA